MPGFGGPKGLGAVRAPELGDTVYTYGNSSLRQGITKLSPKQGVVVEGAGNGWSRTVYTLTPGVPGDSGSGFMSAPARRSARSRRWRSRRSPPPTESATCARS